MGFLGTDFIISSLLVICVSIAILYYFRKIIFKLLYKDKNTDLFIKQVKEYLLANHSKISFDFSIVDKSREEPNPTTRAYIIIDNIVQQYSSTHIHIPISSAPIEQNQLWDSYTFNAKPIGTKLPSDWSQRKSVTLQRDKNICQRCGYKVKPENAHLFLIKSIKEGGQFYLENLVILCKDCDKITAKKDLKYLDIKDTLNSFIQ